MDVQVTSLPSGRNLEYCCVGKGYPVMYFHGTASSRLEVLLLKDFAECSGLQIICVDRPGYGLSTYRRREHLQDFNADVNFIANFLGFDRFAVLGWSGGGAFALAYLAQFSQRVTKAIVASAPSLPFDVTTAHNIPLAQYIMKIPYVGIFAMRQLRRQVLRANNNIPAFLASRQGKRMLRGYSASDLKFFSDPAWAKLMYQSMAEAFRQDSGVKAVVEEHMLFLKPWGFPIEEIPEGKLVIWHGEDDKTVSVRNGYSLVELVKGSKLDVFKGKGHCAMFSYQDKLAKVLLE